MSVPPETGLSDPAYLRYCMRPDCKASFNIGQQMGSGPYVYDWHMVQMFASPYLCPRHARLVMNGIHKPGWIWDAKQDNVLGVKCSCGWDWKHGGTATNGECREQWAAHLVRVDP